MKYKVIFFCRSANGGYKCPKCAKIVEDKAGLRKHLVYHTHREKKYMYQCPQCPALSADSSNLKRHIASVHEKHLFCCKLCDFKDYKKKHLEDHIELVHTNESLQKKNTTKEIEFADQENVQVEISNLAEEERDASDMMQVIKQITFFLNAFFQPVLSSSRSSVANVNVRKKHWKIFKNIKPKNTSLSLVKILQ